MPIFRKRPVCIEAFQFDGTFNNAVEIVKWMVPTAANVIKWAKYDSVEAEYQLAIPTSEGVKTASPNDWVIRGVHGEFYPCKPEIFAATYEPVE